MKHIEDKRVRDLMTHGVVTVPEYAKVINVIKILNEGHVHGVVVVGKEGKAVGVISEIDIPKAFGKDLGRITAKEIMSSPVKTIDVNSSILDATKIMKKKNIDRLFILDKKGFPRGIISITDVINEIVSVGISGIWVVWSNLHRNGSNGYSGKGDNALRVLLGRVLYINRMHLHHASNPVFVRNPDIDLCRGSRCDDDICDNAGKERKGKMKIDIKERDAVNLAIAIVFLAVMVNAIAGVDYTGAGSKTNEITTNAVGLNLFGNFLVGFEVLALLLTASLVGAIVIVIAYKDKK